MTPMLVRGAYFPPALLVVTDTLSVHPWVLPIADGCILNVDRSRTPKSIVGSSDTSIGKLKTRVAKTREVRVSFGLHPSCIISSKRPRKGIALVERKVRTVVSDLHPEPAETSGQTAVLVCWIHADRMRCERFPESPAEAAIGVISDEHPYRPPCAHPAARFAHSTSSADPVHTAAHR